jgi:lipopolysaccharide biosynthesis protein
MRVAVLMHLFHQDLWYELADYVSNLPPSSTDLYVNLVEGNPQNDLQAQRIHRRFPQAHVQVTENRGRDIGGFLRLIDTVLKTGRTYDFVILMHSKKSLRQNPQQAIIWRTFLLRSILGWPARAAEVARLFRDDPRLGMVGSQDWLFNDDNRPEFIYLHNQPLIDEYCRRFALNPGRGDFIAGTMFWARAQPFLGFFARHDPLALAAELEEGDPSDDHGPTRTHSLERIFAYLITSQGYTIRGLKLGA